MNLFKRAINKFYQLRVNISAFLYEEEIRGCNLQAHYWKRDERYHQDFRAVMANRWHNGGAKLSAGLLEQKFSLQQRLNTSSSRGQGQ